MPLSLRKTARMSMSHILNPLAYPYSLDSVLLEKVDKYKNLSSSIRSNLRWNTRVTNTVKKPDTRLAFPRRFLKLASTETRLLAYKILVRPLLGYSSEVWNPRLWFKKRKARERGRKRDRQRLETLSVPFSSLFTSLPFFKPQSELGFSDHV